MKASNAISSNDGAQPERRPGNADSSSSTDERFRLTGPSLTLDPRIHAYRNDIADIALAGQIFAPHYARPLRPRLRRRAPTPVRATPGGRRRRRSPSCCPGEEFAVLEYAGGWAWGYCRADHLVGYVEAIALADPIEPTHIVCEKSAPVAADGAITAPITRHRCRWARGFTARSSGACLATEYGCVALSHLRPIGDHERRSGVVAERLIGAP